LLFESIRKRGCCYLGFETFRRIRWNRWLQTKNPLIQVF
jgi:hypothetical protein